MPYVLSERGLEAWNGNGIPRRKGIPRVWKLFPTNCGLQLGRCHSMFSTKSSNTAGGKMFQASISSAQPQKFPGATLLLSKRYSVGCPARFSLSLTPPSP